MHPLKQKAKSEGRPLRELLAELAPKCGLSAGFLSLVVSGHRALSTASAKRVAKASGLSAADLLLWERPAAPPARTAEAAA